MLIRYVEREGQGGRQRVFFVSFGYTKDAEQECAAFHKRTGRIIKLLTAAGNSGRGACAEDVKRRDEAPSYMASFSLTYNAFAREQEDSVFVDKSRRDMI